MKKLLLIIPTLAIVSLYASNNKKVEQIKVIVPKVEPQKIYIDPPKCPSDAYLTNTSSEIFSSDIPPYKHCTSCRMGAMLGNEGEERCSYCGKGE